MADMSSVLKEYDNRIQLSKTNRERLRTSRNTLRESIRTHIEEKYGEPPRFFQQGSFSTQTIITPSDEDFDVDDGVYFLEEICEERKTVDTYHRWVKEAVDAHSNEAEGINKNTCIRAVYKAGYHIDLPIYWKKEGETPELAHLKDDWSPSDPKKLLEWQRERFDKKGQAKRIIRYLKGWKDAKPNLTIPSGIVLTLLALQNMFNSERDDECVVSVLERIQNALQTDFACYRPVAPVGENLLDDWSDNNKNSFLSSLSRFLEDGKRAVAHPEKKAACLYWKAHLGTRMSCPEDRGLDEAKSFESTSIIGGSARSARSE